MADVWNWKFIACCFLFVGYAAAADDANELDDMLKLTLLTPVKTQKGQTVFEGDIVQDVPNDGKYNDHPVKALPNKGGLWLERVIPYAFHGSVNKTTKEIVIQAMSNWEEKTCLKFVPRTTQRQFLRFRTDSGGCFTFVGRKHMEGQDVNLGPGCEHLQIAMHEIGHSLGFYHEHSRRDRSTVLKILWHNIQKGMAGQFSPGNDDSRAVPYDVTSVMHYSPMSFSSQVFEKNTMVSLDPRLQALIGRSRGITFRDAKLANTLYTCDDGCPNRNTLQCLNEGFLSPHRDGPCHCVCPPNTKGKRCEKLMGDYYGNMCGGSISEERIITTPGYPKRKANDSCTWEIKAPIGRRVEVLFEDFSFRSRMDKPNSPYHGFCVYEQIEIRTRNMDEGDFYCGEDISPGTTLVSNSNFFLILFRADTKAEGRGLKASIKFI
ncbi:blastula protease 10-like [Uloborus diversus]|uniref:blastula protease 10-like n=1 Tax=Uloborus diversus TaxID=327109 RepID=UPI00240A66B7|nr:blastula protease 10-like [Uloborus diversus]